MPPKRKVVAKKAVVTEEIPELNVVEEIPELNVVEEIPELNVVEEIPELNVVEEIPELNVEENIDNRVKNVLDPNEKLLKLEDRMANVNTKVATEKMLVHPENIIDLTLSDDDEEDKKDLKQPKRTYTRPKRVIPVKNLKEVKNTRKRAISEDRQTQVEIKSRRKQGKVESAVSPLVDVTKKILRSASVDRLASAKPITIDVKNKNNKKPKIPDDSSKLPQRLALKKKEELPSKPKRTKKNVLNTEENVPAISPPDKLKTKGTKKKQVIIDKDADNLDTLQELPKQTGKTKTALKKLKLPTNKIKKVLKGARKAPEEISKPDEKLEASTDENDSDSSDNDTVPEVKVVKRPNNIKKQDDIEKKDVEDQLNESYVISDDDVLIISEPAPKSKKIKKPRLVKGKAANKQTKSKKKDDSDSTDIDTAPKLKVVKRANDKKQPGIEQIDVEDQLEATHVVSDNDDGLIMPKPESKMKYEEKPQRLYKAIAVNRKGLKFARPGRKPKGNMEVTFESDLNLRRRLKVPEQTPHAEVVLEDPPNSSEESGIDLQVNNDLEEVLPKESSPEENKIGLKLRKRGRKAKVDLEKVLPKDGSP